MKPPSPLHAPDKGPLKPPSPLHAPDKGPLKPPSPLRPKSAPKMPISHPQRRCRFQSHTGTSEQRRQGFQTTGPPGRQGQAAAHANGDDTASSQISHAIPPPHESPQAQKPQNINDQNPHPDMRSRELHAKLLVDSHSWVSGRRSEPTRRTTGRHTKPHASTPDPTGVEGAGGTGGHGRASRSTTPSL